VSITNVHEAKSQLSKLIEQAERGEVVIIARSGKPVAMLVAYKPDQAARQGGQWRGKIRVAKDFDDLPKEIALPFGIVAQRPKRNDGK